MKLYGLRVFVDDIEAARIFYGQTLGLAESWSMPAMKAAGFSLGNAELIVEEADPEGEHADLVGRFVGVSLQVDDVDQTFRELRAKGVAFTAPPEAQPWGGVLAHFADPAGNVLTLLGGAKKAG